MDAIVKVEMNGKVVRERWFFDHVVQDIDPARPASNIGGITP